MRRAEIALFIVKRTVFALPLLLGVVVVNFLLIQLAPGDPISVLVGDAAVTPEYMDQIREAFA